MKGKKVFEVYPELVKYFKNKEDAYNYTIRSEKKVVVKCPDCGHEHYMYILNLTRRHYKCPVCGNGNSYCEKLVLSLFDQLKIKYIYHLNKKTFEWCDKYIYDFYLPDYNIIIETNGLQHYVDGFKKNVEETKKNDEIKKEIALKNGIKNVIYIDCSNRDLIFLKKEIMKSLENLIDFKNVDWTQCVQTASKSKIYEYCKIWEKEKDKKTTVDLAKELGITRDLLVRYLHRGNDAGFCVYDGKKEKIRASKKGGNIIKKNRTKKIEVYDINDNFLMEINSAKELVKLSKEKFGVEFTYGGIIYTCNGTQKTHKGFKFKYKQDD